MALQSNLQKYFGSSAGLLPWQRLFLFFLIGLFSFRYPLPSSVAAILLYFFYFQQLRSNYFFFKSFLIFALGYVLAWWVFPFSSQHIEVFKWMKKREKIEMTGHIEQVRTKANNRLQIILSDIVYLSPFGRQNQLAGKVVWTWENPSKWPDPGQDISARLRLKPVRGFLNPGTWDSRFYWALKGVKYRTYTKGNKTRIDLQGKKSWPWELRQKLRQNIVDFTSKGPGQGLLLALLMGDRSKLSYSTLNLVRKASLAHSLALSGLHLGFLVSLAWLLAWSLGKIYPQIYLFMPRQKLMIFLAAPLILIYLWLGQFRPSLLRASLMFFFWGLLLLQGKKKVLLDGLFFALLVIVVLWPLSVFDLGLQLSVVAVTGIILMWPLFSSLFQSWWQGSKFKRLLLFPISILAISAIANIALLPLIVWNFGQFSMHLYLNILWLPVLGWIVLPMGLMGLGLSILPLPQIIGESLLEGAAVTLNFLVYLLQFLQAYEWLEVIVPQRCMWPEMFGYWILLMAVVFFWHRRQSFPKWRVLIGLSLLLLPSVSKELRFIHPEVSMHLVDVGQGQAVYVQGPEDTRVLIDGGGSWNKEFDMGRFVLAPFLIWGRSPKIDYVVLTHPDFDHMRGLYYILENFKVKKFLYNGVWPQGWDGEMLKMILSKEDIPSSTLHSKDKINLGRGLKIKVLHPPKNYEQTEKNDTSLVLKLAYKDRGLALIPGDIEESGLQTLMQSGQNLQAKVLVLPHHGSRTSLCPEFYQMVDPELALVSCGYLNYFNFPHNSVIKALEEQHIPLKSTAEHGAIQIKWRVSSSLDGSDYSLQCFSRD